MDGISYSEMFWSPLLWGQSHWFAVIPVAACTLMSAGAFWWNRCPSGITKRERLFYGIQSRSTLLNKLRGAMLPLAMVFALLLGLVLLFLPFHWPTVLIHASRVPSASNTLRESRWTEVTSDWTSDKKPWFVRVVDVGPLVDEICDEAVAKSPLGGWSRDSDEHREQLKTILLETINRQERGLNGTLLEPLETGKTRLPAKTRVDLPAWLIESIEISALRAVVQRRNVRRMAILHSNRNTLGPEAWAGIPDFLQTPWLRKEGDDETHDDNDDRRISVNEMPSSQREQLLARYDKDGDMVLDAAEQKEYAEDRQRIRLTSVPFEHPYQLIDFAGPPQFVEATGKLTAEALIRVASLSVFDAATDDGTKPYLDLVVRGCEIKEPFRIDTSKAPPKDVSSIRRIGVEFHVTSGTFPLHVGAETPDPFFPRTGHLAASQVSPNGTTTKAMRNVAIIVESEELKVRWEQTLKMIQSGPPEPFVEWIGRLNDEYFLRTTKDAIKFSVAVRAPRRLRDVNKSKSADIVIEANESSVWVYSGGLFVNSLPKTQLRMPPDTGGPTAAGSTTESVRDKNDRASAADRLILARTFTTPHTSPGVYSCDALPFVDCRIEELTDPVVARTLVTLTKRSILPQEFDRRPIWDEKFRKDSHGSTAVLPVVSRFQVPHSDGSIRLVTHLGFTFNSQGLLLDDSGQPDTNFDSARFRAFWTTVFESLYAGFDPSTEGLRATDNLQGPIAILEARDLPAVSAISYVDGLRLLLFGTVLYSAFYLYGIFAVPSSKEIAT